MMYYSYNCHDTSSNSVTVIGDNKIILKIAVINIQGAFKKSISMLPELVIRRECFECSILWYIYIMYNIY